MTRSRAGLLIIDMQLGLVTGAHAEKDVLQAVNSLTHRARATHRPVIFVQHNHASFAPLMKGGEGWAIHPDLTVADSDILIEKEASDAFYHTELEAQLHELDVSLVLVMGMQTEYCVDATCRSALSKDFDVTLVEDGHTTGPSHLSASRIIEHHNIILANLAHPNSQLRVRAADEILRSELP